MKKSSSRYGLVAALAALAALLVMAVGASAAFGASEFKAAKFPVSFTGSGGAARFESDGSGFGGTPNVITCEKSKSSGSVVGKSEAKVIVTYEEGTGKKECEIKGSANGKCGKTIKTEELKVHPEEIGGTGTKRGLLFTSTLASKVLAVVHCPGVFGAEEVKVEGELICESSPVKTPTTTGTVTCKEEESGGKEVPGEQLFTTITGSSTEHLMKATGPFTNEEDAQVTTEMLTYKENVEQT